MGSRENRRKLAPAGNVSFLNYREGSVSFEEEEMA